MARKLDRLSPLRLQLKQYTVQDMVQLAEKRRDEMAASPSAAPDFFEEWNARVVERRLNNLQLSINDFTGTRFCGEGRLLGLLTSAKEHTVPVIVKLPAPLPEFGDCPHHKFWDFFLHSIQGVLLTSASTNISDSRYKNQWSAIQNAQFELISKNLGVVHSGKHVAAPVWDKFGYPNSAPFLKTKNIVSFEPALKGYLFNHLGLRLSRGPSVSRLCEFVFETLQNTQEHGRTDLDGKLIEGIRFVSFRRLNLGREGQILEEMAVEQDPPLVSYFQLLRRRWLKNPPKSLVIITVADSGVGIAAKMARAEGIIDIYTEDLQKEKHFLLKAFTPTGTSKPKSVAGAGLGLYKALEATKELDGLILVRAGRLCMYRHFISRTCYSFSTELFSWDQHKYAKMGGTSVNLFFPWW